MLAQLFVWRDSVLEKLNMKLKDSFGTLAWRIIIFENARKTWNAKIETKIIPWNSLRSCSFWSFTSSNGANFCSTIAIFLGNCKMQIILKLKNRTYLIRFFHTKFATFSVLGNIRKVHNFIRRKLLCCIEFEIRLYTTKIKKALLLYHGRKNFTHLEIYLWRHFSREIAYFTVTQSTGFTIMNSI